MKNDELVTFESQWSEIYNEGIERVFRIADYRINEGINLTQYSKLYTIAYNMCTSKSASITLKVYERLTDVIKNYCERIFEKIRYSPSLLFDFVTSWTSYNETVVKWILKVFNILTRDNFKAKKNLNLEMDLKKLFRNQVYENIKQGLQDKFFEMINKERNNEIIDPTILKKFIKFMTSIEVDYMEFLYNNAFEMEIVEKTLEYYRFLISEGLKTKNFINYLSWGLEVLKNEESRLGIYLPNTTVQFILQYLKENLFYCNSKDLLETLEGFKKLLETQDLPELRKTYLVFSEDPKSLQLMVGIFKNYIKQDFKYLLDKNDSQCNFNDGPREVIVKTNYIEEFVIFYSNNQKIITESFGGSNIFNVSYKEVLENLQASSSKFNNSYILPFYIDRNLKRTPNNHSAEASGIIDKILCVFPTLPDKDVFLDIHRNLLTNRILNEDFISLDTEKVIINRLKLLCGVEFTSNLEGIINDYYLNKDLNERYSTYLKKITNKPLESYFSILNPDFWPSLNTYEIKLPPQIQYSVETFSNYFTNNNPKKLLKWSFSFSNMELEGKFDKNYIFSLNFNQGLILLCFYREKQINFKQIIEKTGIVNEKDLKTYLNPLIYCKILIKSDDNSECFKINMGFTFNSKRVKILCTPKNEEIVRKEKIEDDRAWAIEATIVRIMKSTKRLHHNDLVKRVLEQMDFFKIQIQTIKKKIDNLLERELILRDKEDANYYIYSSS